MEEIRLTTWDVSNFVNNRGKLLTSTGQEETSINSMTPFNLHPTITLEVACAGPETYRDGGRQRATGAVGGGGWKFLIFSLGPMNF